MKVLIQNGNYNLVWKDAVWKNGSFRSLDERETYDNSKIFSVKDDDSNKIVVCPACKQEIRNTPAAIRKHQNMINEPNKCFECRYMRPINSTILSQKYVRNEDGTYAESTKRTVNLVCGNSYGSYDINSPDARRACKYSNCETAIMRPVEDFWTKYPNAFDEFITVDKIIEYGYTSVHKYEHTIEFDIKCKSKLTAFTNGQGLCYGFQLHYHRRYYELRYSAKYDKLFVLHYGLKELSCVDISEATQEQILKKMSALYS